MKGYSVGRKQSVGPDLDPSCLTLIVFLRDIFEEVDFAGKVKNMAIYPAYKAGTKQAWIKRGGGGGGGGGGGTGVRTPPKNHKNIGFQAILVRRP